MLFRQVDYADDIDVVMPMCNLMEYSVDQSKTLWILWQYGWVQLAMKDANGNIVNFTADNATTDSFKIKEKWHVKQKTKAQRMVKLFGLLFLENAFKMPLISSKINLDLKLT